MSWGSVRRSSQVRPSGPHFCALAFVGSAPNAGLRVPIRSIWENATWHRSQLVRTWLRTHNQQVKHSGTGVRILSCLLPTKSPWLNPIEAKWVHGKKNVVEADRLLTASELESRVSAYFACSP